MAPSYRSHWQPYTDGLSPCLLKLPGSGETAKEPLSESIRLKRLDLPEPARHEDFLVIVAAAWGLILSFYCGSNDVCFGIQDRRGKHVSTTLCRMHADPADALEECLDKIRMDLAQGARFPCKTGRDLVAAAEQPEATRLWNTGIVWSEFDPGGGLFDAGEVGQRLRRQVPDWWLTAAEV